MDNKKSVYGPSNTGYGQYGAFGNAPIVDEDDLEAVNRVVTSTDQGVSMCQTDIDDARKLIINARLITAAKQGAPPFNPARLKEQLKGWKSNTSTRFLQTELRRAAPRLYLSVLNASTLTAASLPAGWPKGQQKQNFFRDEVTRTIRSWNRNDPFWRGLGAEVVDYGFGFACWTDRFQWKPHLVRMDKGFVPRGTEIMEENLARFTLKWEYEPNQLLSIARKSVDSGADNWDKEAVAAAVQAADIPPIPGDYSNLRKWEELIREQVWDFSYTKGNRVVETRHLFVLEFSGKISHYIFWPDGPADQQLLYEKLDAFDRMQDCVVPVCFGYGDGTIHGSWGAGQLLYDLALKVEKIRNDSIDNLMNSNKVKLQVPNAKDAASVQLLVNDSMVIATGAQFAQNVGGISPDPQGYMVLDKEMSRWAQEVIGGYLPPIPSQPSDIKAAQVNAALQQEQAIQQDVQENWLKQVAMVVDTMIRRLTDPDSDESEAIALRAKLLGKDVNWFKQMFRKMRKKIEWLDNMIPPSPVSLTEMELEMLVNQPVIQTVSDFTPMAALERGKFAASVIGNHLFNQTAAARYMAAGVPGNSTEFVEAMVVPEGDTTTQTGAARQQKMENTSMLMGQEMAVLVTDLHEVHLETLKPDLEKAIEAGMVQPAALGLKHASAHFAAGNSTKTLPPESINTWKSWLATMQKALEAKQQEQAQAELQKSGIGAPGGAIQPPQ